MMTTANPTHTWRTDVYINGQPFPTRHPAPDYGDNSDAYLGDLPDHQRQYLRAIHEAGHAVAGLAARAHIHYAKITPAAKLATAAPTSIGVSGGDVFACNFPDGQATAVYLGAGERAEDRWLHQNHLWTSTRAVGIELGSYSDRRRFLAINPHFGFGADRNDYRVVHDLADDLVAQHWNTITAVADVLVNQIHLTGDQIADLAQFPNGTHSTTCTGTPAA